MIGTYEQIVRFDQLKRAIFCPHCVRIDIMQSKAACNRPDCTCDSVVGLPKILDLYAAFYYHLDNVNLVHYWDYERLDAAGCLAARRQAEELWSRHLAHGVLYTTALNWSLQPATIELIRSHLLEAKSAPELLARMVAWLKVLDGHLQTLRIHMEKGRPQRTVVTTRYGEVLIKRVSPLRIYLEEQTDYKAFTDPNYLLVRQLVENFHLAKSEYPYYTVRHKVISFPLTIHPDQIGTIKFGFFPGKADLEQDYTISTEQKVNVKGNLPFTFTGLKKPSLYTGKVLRRFQKMLRQKPDIVMMPELFAPLELQERFKMILKKNSLNKVRPPMLMMTGSFHANQSQIEGLDCAPDPVFNYAQLTNGAGEKLADLYKMNPFIFEAKEGVSGELAPFEKVNGEENNACSEREVVLFETPLGRAAVLICIDFLNDELEKLLIDRHVDVIFVMAMTPHPQNGKFARKMQAFGERIGAVVFICNNLGTPVVNEPRIVVYLPGFGVFTSSEEVAVLTFDQILTACRVQRKIRKAAQAVASAVEKVMLE